LSDQLREERVYNAITKAKAAGWKSDKIVPILREYGIDIKETTFDQYWRDIQRDIRGDTKSQKTTATEGKSSAKPKTTKVVRAAIEGPKVSEAKPDDKPPTSETTPATGSGGKPLGKRDDHRGAFSDDV